MRKKLKTCLLQLFGWNFSVRLWLCVFCPFKHATGGSARKWRSLDTLAKDWQQGQEETQRLVMIINSVTAKHKVLWKNETESNSQSRAVFRYCSETGDLERHRLNYKCSVLVNTNLSCWRAWLVAEWLYLVNVGQSQLLMQRESNHISDCGRKPAGSVIMERFRCLALRDKAGSESDRAHIAPLTDVLLWPSELSVCSVQLA